MFPVSGEGEDCPSRDGGIRSFVESADKLGRLLNVPERELREGSDSVDSMEFVGDAMICPSLGGVAGLTLRSRHRAQVVDESCGYGSNRYDGRV